MALPAPVDSHDALLTVNSLDLPNYEDTTPGVLGVDAQPLLLDPHTSPRRSRATPLEANEVQAIKST